MTEKRTTTTPLGADRRNLFDAARLAGGEVVIVTEGDERSTFGPLNVPDNGIVATRVVYKCGAGDGKACGQRVGRVDDWVSAEGKRVVAFFGYSFPKDAHGEIQRHTRVRLRICTLSR